MNEFRTAKEALQRCEIKGQLLPLAEVNKEQIQTFVEFADGDQEAAQRLANGLETKSILWNNVYASYYDALHKLVDAYLRFDKFTSLNHICLFAYLSEKHPELDLDWNFFEKIRTKRNGIHYYGQKASKEDFLGIEVQIKVYCQTLKKAIEKKLSKN